MSVNVIVTGLPSEAIFTKLVFSFKGLLRKIAIRKFWIREIVESYDLESKQMTVEFTSHAEARKARGFLNNLPFIYGNMEYNLKARMAADGGGPQMETDMEENWGRRRRPVQRERRQRSRSPGYRQEASKLDMEIELLRKQRQVIEEERRLLLEQKKLEMIREYGPGATRKLDDFNDYEPPRKRRHPEPVQAKRPRKRSPPPAHKPPRSNPNALPAFFQPCKKLIADLKPFIFKDTTSEEAGILVKLIRAAIRKSLAVALDGKDFMPTGEIIKLYREMHPKENDEHFVAKILANIRASYLTDTKTTKIVKEENDTENQKNDEDVTEKQTDTENECQGDQVTDKIVPQETPTNEENATDAATDLNIEVKSEPNPSQEPEKVIDVSKQPENVSDELSQEPKIVPGEVSQEPETASGEVSQEPETVSDKVAHESQKAAGESSPATGKASGEIGPVVTETNDAAEFDKEFALDEVGSTTDFLTEGDLQDADDWVDEQ